MKRMILLLAGCLALSACGLGETAVSAAAAGAGEAAQAKEALKTEAHVKDQLDAAATLETQHRQAAEDSTR
jgi:ABC-type glycerol-3-phosphate transport system substrate-binding protein